ncbi:4Fe-4S dicluster domain-containing protein [Calderihabitans maritimus]|uniref:Fe-S protein n=1 Tax=Calderihabitans maritimus TaxID=1246530 RepID=A0A1Z5HVX2_9FIRM|nr:4Fe-4S dicluster domain-containing protein [Calderihabitans maritimus]GAW93465.1 Fe-S protein [Calderihabitans maritimus]
MGLTEEVKEYLYSQGADLVGIAGAESLKEAPEGCRPTDYLPTTKSVISIGYALNRGPVLNLPQSRNEYLLEFECANSTLNHLGHKIAKFIEKKGFDSMAFPATASIGDGARLRGDISHKHAAVAAGLGCFGVNNLILTPDYGSRVRLATVITEVELTPDQPFKDSLCNRCGKCVRNCPAGALTGWEELYTPEAGWRMDKEKCYHYIFVKLGGRRCGMCIAACPLSRGLNRPAGN